MNDQPKNPEDESVEEPFDLSFLEEDLAKLPNSPPEESGAFDGAKFGAIEIDPSAPLEEQIEAAMQKARDAGLSEDVVDRLKQAITSRMGAADGLLNTARNFATSAAFATMLAGSDEFTQALGLLGHEYHKKLVKIFGDMSVGYAQIPICQCELTNQPNLNHQHSAITPPGAPADYDEKRKQFVGVTKRFQRDCAALSTLVFGIGIGGVQFGNEEHKEI
jgi:hypothetical protein